MSKPTDFTKEELEALIPQKAYEMIGKATPEELIKDVKFHQNLDETHKTELLMAFSYYEALNEHQRNGVKYAFANLSVNYLLNWIGQNNVKLLETIESLFDKGVPIIEWLEEQITRMKACLLTFDEMLNRGAKNGTTINPNTSTSNSRDKGFSK